jgi:FAD/FMN-containing dehydrogenase
LARSVDGTLRLPGDAGYADAHQLFDPDFDSLRPAAVLAAASADDVATAVAWAVGSGVVVTGRSGGHSYVGASAASGALVIDVRKLSAVHLDGQDAVVGAGANLATVYNRLGAAGRVIPGGSCPTVGIAGLTLGGGVGWAVRGYGLTCDRLQAVDLVGADGRLRQVTAADRDEFWACRGGGGGMLGIATAFRLSTVPAPRITTYYARWLWSDAVHVVSRWQQWQAGRPAHVWSNLHLDVSPSNRDVIVFGADLSNGGDRALESLIQAVGIEPPGRIVRPDQRLGPDGSSQRQRFAAGTDIVLDRYSGGQIHELVAGMTTAQNYGVAGSCIIDTLGGAAGKSTPDSAWPWRRAFGTVQWYAGLGASASARPARAWIAHMHGCVPDNGGYINYLEKARPRAAHYLGRDNAARLARLRATTGADQRFVQPLEF